MPKRKLWLMSRQTYACDRRRELPAEQTTRHRARPPAARPKIKIGRTGKLMKLCAAKLRHAGRSDWILAPRPRLGERRRRQFPRQRSAELQGERSRSLQGQQRPLPAPELLGAAERPEELLGLLPELLQPWGPSA